MWPVIIANILIEIAWITASVILICKGHPLWAAIAIIIGFFSGYNFKVKSESQPSVKPKPPDKQPSGKSPPRPPIPFKSK